MKIKLAFLGLLAFSAFSSFSQESYVGLKGGYNRSSLKSENTSDLTLQNKHAYTIALVICSVSEQLPLGMSIEPGYTLKGARTEEDSVNYRFHYLNMPLLLDIYPVKRLKLSAGPEISYLAGAKNDTVSVLNTYDKRWEISGTVGISYSLSFFADIGLRYNMAFTKVAEYDPLLDRRNLFNQYVQVNLVLKIAN